MPEPTDTETPTKVYIAGSISDGGTLPIEVQALRRLAFDGAEERLRAAGYEPINPMRRGVSERKTWLDYMRDSLRDIAEADGVALLPGWHGSRGARAEFALTVALGLPVLDLETWVPR